MRFIVCGEALIDLAHAPVDSDSAFRSTWQALSAGGPMNTAVALAQLDTDVEYLGRLSSDRFGRQLAEHLSENRVGTTLVVTDDQPTSVAVVSLDEQRKASYAFHFSGTTTFDWHPEELPELQRDDWFHCGSLLSIVEPGASVVLEWLQRCEARLSFDINVRSAVVDDPDRYWTLVEPWIAAVGRRHGVVKASDDDVAFLARAGGGQRDPLELATDWVRRYELAVFVMTLGPDGAVAVTADGEQVRVPGHSVEVEDTVGAGDTFMAGFLAAYASDPAELRFALQQGAAASAIVCGRQGAQPPTLLEVQEYLGLMP